MSLDSTLWAIHAGGTCTFGELNVGAKFKFPKSDIVFVKMNHKWFVAPDDYKYQTGQKTAVIEIKE